MVIKRTVKRVLLLNPLTASTVIFYDAITGERTFEGSIGAAEQWIIDQGAEVVESVTQDVADLGGAITGISLDFIRNLGGALVDGIDGGYDAIKAKLDLEPDDVVAGFTIAALSILAGVYLYHSVKAAQDAV
jgi:hypothetical protein